MKNDSAALYLQLRDLVATMPSLSVSEWSTPATLQWLGRASALVEAGGNRADAIFLSTAADGLGGILHESNVTQIRNVVHRALARAELAAPSELQGQFISAGEALTAFAAVAKIFQRATRNLLLVDAYAEANLLTDFAISAPEGVTVRVLTVDREARKSILRPAAERWQQQFGNARPLEIRVAPSASIHDRLILVDDSEAWVPGQSYNAMAKTSHTSIARTDADLAAHKVAAYGDLWDKAVPL